MAKNNGVNGVLLVGSIPYANSGDVFKNVSKYLGDYIKRIPDGETGERSRWIDWQVNKLLDNPNLEAVTNDEFEYQPDIRMIRLKSGCNSKELAMGELGYSEAAIKSYKVFKKLKSSGEIPEHIRFQVSLPTPLAITHAYVHPSLQADFEPQHEAKLLEELAEILDKIPHQDLAIQWDTAVEFAILEGIMPTYLKNMEAEINEILIRIATVVPETVELGFHFCYGDAGHKHFCEPKDMSKLVSVSNRLTDNLKRQIDWIHIPVPKDRFDDDYYSQLNKLNVSDGTELFLGLVHYTDGIEGTNKRIDTARKFVSEFGVATECGFGRRPQETINKLLAIHAGVSSPVI